MTPWPGALPPVIGSRSARSPCPPLPSPKYATGEEKQGKTGMVKREVAPALIAKSRRLSAAYDHIGLVHTVHRQCTQVSCPSVHVCGPSCRTERHPKSICFNRIRCPVLSPHASTLGAPIGYDQPGLFSLHVAWLVEPSLICRLRSLSSSASQGWLLYSP